MIVQVKNQLFLQPGFSLLFLGIGLSSHIKISILSYECQVYVFFFELIVDFWNFNFTVYSCFLDKYCEYILEVWKIKANVIGVQSK